MSAVVKPTDTVLLSHSVPLPWPAELVRCVGIGRNSANGVVLEDPKVSGFHARLLLEPGSPPLIEDVGSANGTFLNSLDRRISGPTPFAETDRLFFGSFAMPASRLLARARGLRAGESSRTLVFRPIGSDSTAASTKRLSAWSLIPPLFSIALAVVVALAVGHPAEPTDPDAWTRLAQTLGAVTFALTMIALWLGCSIGLLLHHEGVRRRVGRSALVGSRLAILGSICALGSGLPLAILSWGTGLRGPAIELWGVLALTSIVGLVLGLGVSVLAPTKGIVGLLVSVSFLAMFGLGGWLVPVHEMHGPTRWFSSLSPSRWAFEALLIIESSEYHDPASPFVPAHDLAEAIFPVDSERMGPRADFIALVAMLIGVVGVIRFIRGEQEREVALRI